MVRRHSVAIAWLAAAIAVLVPGKPAVACSPPFEPPTIEDLGPAQVVVMGTIGERVAGGRRVNLQLRHRLCETPFAVGAPENTAY